MKVSFGFHGQDVNTENANRVRTRFFRGDDSTQLSISDPERAVYGNFIEREKKS